VTPGRAHSLRTMAGASVHFRHTPCGVCGRDVAVTVGQAVRTPGCGIWDLIPPDLDVRYVRCKHCGLYRTDPMPFPNRKTLRQNMYADEYFGARTAWHGRAQRVGWPQHALDRLESALGAKGRLLDLGCGEAHYLKEAAKRGWTCLGVDVSPSIAGPLPREIGVQVFEGTLEEADLPQASFDCVLANSILEHVPNPRQTLGDIRRVLKGGGVALVVVPNADNLLVAVRALSCRLVGIPESRRLSPCIPPYHVVGFTRRSIQCLAEVVGFEIVSLAISGGRHEWRKNPVRSLRHPVFFAHSIAGWIADHIGRGLTVTALLRKPIQIARAPHKPSSAGR
jgi:SAM-dependent methyltransferase